MTDPDHRPKSKHNAPSPSDDAKDTAPALAPLNEEDSTFPRPLRWTSLWPGFVVALIALLAIPFANQTYHPIYHFLRRLPLSDFYSAATQFPSTTFVTLILSSIFVLQPRRRKSIAYCLIALLVSGFLNETIKHTASRARPQYSIQMGKDEKAWIVAYKKAHPDAQIRTERVDQWVGLTAQYPRFKDGYASFPSGHANGCFVLAAYLSALYPEGRVLWYLAAGGTGLARVVKERHWPEDVLFGGSLGWIMARVVFSWAWPGRLGALLLGGGGRRKTFGR